LPTHAFPIGAQMGVPPSAPGFPPTGGGSGASQEPFVQLDVQQSKPVVQAPAVGVQTVLHVLLVGSQCPPQHSASLEHVAVSPLQPVGGAMQRGGLKSVSSQRSFALVAPQHPFCGPELQVSPVGRHVEFAGSIMH
jgi:hypothetical protein